jgi:flagellar assembly protein FliH
VLRRDKFAATSPFSFQDLERKARAILDQAREQSRQIVAHAEEQGRRRAAQLEQEGFPRGLEEGRRQGFEQARREGAETALREVREELAQLGQALAAALAAFEEDKRRLLGSAERGVLELALAIARRVCRHDAGASSASAHANARNLLEMVKHEGGLELRLNPAECDGLREMAPELIASAGRLSHVEFVPDPTVERGGCVLHARDGTIDASLETQLDRVAQSLLIDEPDDED